VPHKGPKSGTFPQIQRARAVVKYTHMYSPAHRKMVEHHLKGIIAGKRKKLTARGEKELAEKTEKLKKDLTQQNEKMQRALGEVMEERDGLQKTLMEERQQWKKKH